MARQIFYDRLVEDYSRHPRTIILSSHLIDEVANLLESLASATIEARLGGPERSRAQELGLELSPVSLQQLVVRKTMAGPSGGSAVDNLSELEVAP